MTLFSQNWSVFVSLVKQCMERRTTDFFTLTARLTTVNVSGFYDGESNQGHLVVYEGDSQTL